MLKIQLILTQLINDDCFSQEILDTMFDNLDNAIYGGKHSMLPKKSTSSCSVHQNDNRHSSDAAKTVYKIE